MDSLSECDILGMREFALSRHFKVPDVINNLLSDISGSREDAEYDDFLRILSDSKYSEDQIQQICDQTPLCYTFFQSDDGEIENMVIYTLNDTGKLTRWNTYYNDGIVQSFGEFDDFELQIPSLLEYGFVFIPNFSNRK